MQEEGDSCAVRCDHLTVALRNQTRWWSDDSDPSANTNTDTSVRLNTLLMCSPHSSSGPVSHFCLSFSLSMLSICVSFLSKEAFK